jgi:hypothetical protein
VQWKEKDYPAERRSEKIKTEKKRYKYKGPIPPEAGLYFI